jgi:hypothetical protein
MLPRSKLSGQLYASLEKSIASPFDEHKGLDKRVTSNASPFMVIYLRSRAEKTIKRNAPQQGEARN